MEAGNTAVDGSAWPRWTLSSQRAAGGNCVCRAGKERQGVGRLRNRGGGRNDFAYIAVFAKGPGKCLNCLQKPS